MKIHKDRLTIVGVVLVILLVAVVWWMLSDDNDEERPVVSEMHITAEGDDASYCVDFVATEVERDQIEAVITNCGDTTVKIKHGKSVTKLKAGRDYSVTLPPLVKHFKAVAQTLHGEFIGQFSF